MSIQSRSFPRARSVVYVLAAVIAYAGAAACRQASPGGPGDGSTPTCRTFPATSTSVQTFATGEVVSASTTCSFVAASSTVVCEGPFNDSVGGPGTVTQTSLFASRNDIVDEAAANPPLSRSLGTTTVTTASGVSLTTTASNTYDAQKRLLSTVVISPPLSTITTTFSTWDSFGRPTSGTSLGGAITYTYDNASHTVARNIPPNICTVTHDANGIMIKEVCTGTTPSTTNITVLTTQQLCK